MKKLLTLIFMLVSPTLIFSQSYSDYIANGITAKKTLKEKVALEQFKKALALKPRSIEALKNASILCASIGHREKDTKSKKSYYNAAIIYANTALKVNPKSADANFALAVAYGRKVYTIMSPKPRIAMSAKIKKYAERAVQYNPQHNEALTLLGMWHYERATLTLAEKKIVAFLGGLPKGSLEKSIKYLERSKKIEPNNIATLMELGKVYKELGRFNMSKNVWKHALTQTLRYQDDMKRKKEIRKRLSRS